MAAYDYERQATLLALSEQVDLLEQGVGDDQAPLVEDERVLHLQETLQEHVADAASDLMTGIRWRKEQRNYVQTYDVYRRLLGSVALDVAERAFAEESDSGDAKQAVFGYLQGSKRRMVALDYEKRLEKSQFERSKQWLAHHRKTRAVLPFALSVGTTTALFRASDAYSSIVEMTPTQGGIIGAMTVAGSIAIRSLMRTGPTKAGAALKGQFNASLKTYIVDGPEKRLQRSAPSIDELPARYAERHLTLPFGAAAMYLVNCPVKQREDLEPMIDGVLDITEASMHESYGIQPDKLWQEPWYRRLAA